MKKVKGFTLIEIIIVLSLMGIVGLVITGTILSYDPDYIAKRHDQVTQSAEMWAQNLNQEVRVSCMNLDTDMNGYHSCTIFREDKDPLGIECNTEGCRVVVKPARDWD